MADEGNKRYVGVSQLEEDGESVGKQKRKKEQGQNWKSKMMRN